MKQNGWFHCSVSLCNFLRGTKNEALIALVPLLPRPPAFGSFAAARGRDYRLERRGQVVETVNTAGDGAALLERLRVLVGGSDPAIAPAAVRALATQLAA